MRWYYEIKTKLLDMEKIWQNQNHIFEKRHKIDIYGYLSVIYKVLVQVKVEALVVAYCRWVCNRVCTIKEMSQLWYIILLHILDFTYDIYFMWHRFMMYHFVSLPLIEICYTILHFIKMHYFPWDVFLLLLFSF